MKNLKVIGIVAGVILVGVGIAGLIGIIKDKREIDEAMQKVADDLQKRTEEVLMKARMEEA